MPPKPKITRENIVDAAFELARKSGERGITAQSVAEALGCSTQPVMYHFRKVEDLRKAAAEKADDWHSRFLMEISGENPMLEIGLQYIRFAREEPNLFRILFQSGGFSGKNLWESLENPRLQPVLEILAREADLSMEKAQRVFRLLFLTVHGYAGMFASNEMEYDESTIAEDLTLAFRGAVKALKEEKQHV